MSHYSITQFLLLCLVVTSNCYPIEEPTKFLLNTSESKVENMQTPSKLDQAKEFLARIGDGIRIARGRFVNAITLARNNIIYRDEITGSNNVASVINDKSDFFDQELKSLENLRYPPSIFSRITNSRETVHLENESEQSLAEKTLGLPFNDLLINFFNPTPLVDQIKEEEKYGNTADKTNNIGRSFINGFTSFNNLINSAVGTAQNLKTKFGRNITDALNQIGGKLVGLQ